MQWTHSTPVTPSKPEPMPKVSRRRKAAPPQGLLIVSLWPLRYVCLNPATPSRSRPAPKKAANA